MMDYAGRKAYSAIGHHQNIYFTNIHTFQTGCFQAQTNWMKGKQIAAMVDRGNHVDSEGTINDAREFIPLLQNDDDYGGRIMRLDSGARRSFDSGAVRDISEGKGRCDLAPLGIAADWIGTRVFTFIEDYIRVGDPASLWLALDEFVRENRMDKYTALLEASKQYEDGASKYSERNWEKGMPVHCYIDSGVRHYLKFMRGDKDEPHDRAF